MKEHHILLGRYDNGEYVRFGGTESVALHARTRAGKGVSFVIPNCFAWQGSLVVFDIKGEAAKATAGYRQKVLKQDVFIIEPAARSGRSHRWDPFASVNRDDPVGRQDAIAQIASQIFPDSQEASAANSNSAAFWEPAGRQAFTAVACILAETHGAPLTMKTILDLFVRSDGADWLARQITRRLQDGDPYTADAVYGISDFLTGPEQQVEGIRKTVSTRLSAWANPRIAATTSFADVDLRQIRRRPTTIYIVVPPSAVPRMRPLLRLFFHQLIEANTDVTPEDDPTIKWQTLLMMDEFIRLGRMSEFAESIQYISGFGLRAAVIVQSKSQIDARYGAAESQDIFNNVGAEVLFKVNDLKVAREVEERLGDNTQTITTRNRPRFWASMNWNKQSEAEHPHRRPLMLKQEVLGLDPSKQIIIASGEKVITERIFWYTDENFADLVQPMPQPPMLQLHIAYDDGTTRMMRRREEPVTENV